MKNSKLKFSEYMQNISRSKSFGKFFLIVSVLHKCLFLFSFLYWKKMRRRGAYLMNEKLLSTYLPSLIYSRYSECQRSSSSRMVPRSDTMIKADCTRIDRDHTTKKPIISCKNSYWQVSVVSNSGIWSTAVMIKTVSLKKDGWN